MTMQSPEEPRTQSRAPSERLGRLARWLAAAATIGMFLVLIMGATVTNTGSQQGCGQSWPLCHGEFIPSFAVATAIEYSHRLVTSIEGLLIAGLAAASLAGWRRHREIKVLVPLMVFTLLLQAGLGAWAVMAPQNAAVLATHFGVSLTAFASVLLAAAFLFGQHGSERLRDRPLSPRFRAYAFGLIGYVYLLVYLGAYVRHTNASLACTDWPLCNGQVYPGFSGPVGVAFAHRLAALAAALLVAGLVLWARRLRDDRPDLYRGSLAALALILLQALSGAVVVWSRLDIFSALAHAGLATLLFGSLSYVCYQSLPRRSPEAAVVDRERVVQAGATPGGLGAGLGVDR
jgi:cytochrome c oxidase assembly protein subunit 15